eukprot:NODE_842_length_3576_cov_0.392867.p2 type:complete len:169 gc:universal NODE_842_length_3576_cov_0.392867:2165-2671(+)
MIMNLFILSVFSVQPFSTIGVCGVNKDVNGKIRDPKFKITDVLYCQSGNCCSSQGFCGKSDPKIKLSTGYCNAYGQFQCQPEYSAPHSTCLPVSTVGVCGLNTDKNGKVRDPQFEKTQYLKCNNGNCCGFYGYCGKSPISQTNNLGYCNANGSYQCQSKYSDPFSTCK